MRSTCGTTYENDDMRRPCVQHVVQVISIKQNDNLIH